MKSKVISLSAITAGLIAVILTVGAYFTVIDVFSVVLASALVSTPLYYKSVTGSVLCYLAGGLIAFIFFGFNIMSIVFPSYFFFFGIYPIIRNVLRDKKANMYVASGIGLLWFIAFAYGIYFYYTALMGLSLSDLPKIAADNIYLFIALAAVVFFVIFDRFIYLTKVIADRYLCRIIKK